VVELAIDQLYREVMDREDAERWADAADDTEFRAEMEAIAAAFDEPDAWPAR
jgi:hypothetical protein